MDSADLIDLIDLKKIINKYCYNIEDVCTKAIKKYNVRIANDTKNNTVQLVSNEPNLIMVFKPIYVGTYDNHNKIWYWGFNNITVSKEHKKIKKKLEEYVSDLMSNINKYKNQEDIKNYHHYIMSDMLNLSIRQISELLSFLVYFFKSKGSIGQRYTQNQQDIAHYYLVDNILVNNMK